MSVQPLRELVIDAARNPVTFEEFFDAQRDRLFRTLWLITGNRDEAEDLAQEAFVRVLERWDVVRDMDDPAGYLHRTAMNAFRSAYRRAVRAARRAVGLAPPPDLYEEVDARMAARQVLAGLTRRQRAALLLTELLEYTAEEAGVFLGIRASTVRALHFQARSALRSARETPDE